MVLRVFVADDHAILRAGLAALIDLQSDLEVVGQAANAKDTVRGCRTTYPDIALIDLSMPGSGLQAIRELSVACPSTRCVVLTMHDDPSYLQATLDAGAVGYLVKDAAASELTAAIRQVAAGRSYLSISLDREREKPAPDRLSELSPREREVLVLTARGYNNRETAEQLGLKKKTIDTYRVRLRDKLGLTNRAELVEFAVEHGLLKPAG